MISRLEECRICKQEKSKLFQDWNKPKLFQTGIRPNLQNGIKAELFLDWNRHKLFQDWNKVELF